MAPELDLDAIGTVALVWRANGADGTADAVETLVAEVRRLRAALMNRDTAWAARLKQAHDDGDLNCDPWDIWPSEGDA